MIEGRAVIYPGRLSSGMLGVVLTNIQIFWPEALIQGAEARALYPIASTSPDMVPDEFFAYRDRGIADSVDLRGVAVDNSDAILQVINGENDATFVVHTGPGVTQALVTQIINTLKSMEPGEGDHRPVTRSTRWECPKGVVDIDQMLDEVAVHGPGDWENDRGPKDWWAVEISAAGIVAYFAEEADAFRFRLDLINYWLNG